MKANYLFLWICLTALSCLYIFNNLVWIHPWEPTVPIIILGAAVCVICIWIAQKKWLRIISMGVATAAIYATASHICLWNIFKNDLGNYAAHASLQSTLQSESFQSGEDIKKQFDSLGVPIKEQAVNGETRNYIFVMAYPYSGVDSTDLYCFVKNQEIWTLFDTTVLAHTVTGTFDFKPMGDSIAVIYNGLVVYKTGPPKSI